MGCCAAERESLSDHICQDTCVGKVLTELSNHKHTLHTGLCQKSADLFQSVERARIQAIIPVFQPSQPSQARQASQPGQPGIGASSLQASMSAILLYRGSSSPLKAATGRHRADNLLAPTAPGGGSQAGHKPIKYG